MTASLHLSSFLLQTLSLLLMLPSFSFGIYSSDPLLSLDYYKSTCPNVLEIVRKEVECAVLSDPRNAAFFVRLHFHDCFVQGCDASVLLEDTITLQGEKKSSNNINSLKGYRLVDRIKNKLESECPGIVSCADILTIAARDAIILVGGPYWDVPLGRKDSKTASYTQADTNLPTADEGLVGIIDKIYGDFESTSNKDPISESYLNKLKSVCPITGGDNNVTAMDYVTPNLFDNSFYTILLRGEGLLHSDQEMYSSLFAIVTKDLVKKYAADPIAFFEQFSESMVKLGNIMDPDNFATGEVRKNCGFINT
ncbi:hem peroxidase [Dillenia turbinata]|uniref:Peroxidase n=1 Tax=Dillenia turbinata TaxID=194707 RepID=A0AAN8Z0F5_9MAGN